MTLSTYIRIKLSDSGAYVTSLYWRIFRGESPVKAASRKSAKSANRSSRIAASKKSPPSEEDCSVFRV